MNSKLHSAIHTQILILILMTIHGKKHYSFSLHQKTNGDSRACLISSMLYSIIHRRSQYCHIYFLSHLRMPFCKFFSIDFLMISRPGRPDQQCSLPLQRTVTQILTPTTGHSQLPVTLALGYIQGHSTHRYMLPHRNTCVCINKNRMHLEEKKKKNTLS